MGFSIFHSKQTWSSPNSKELGRTDARTREEAEEQADELLRRGYKLNGIIENYGEIAQTAPRSRRRGR